MIARMSFVTLALVLLSGSYQSIKSQKAASINGFDLVDKAGNISKPTDYREHYELLGTYTVLDPKGNQMHPADSIVARIKSKGGHAIGICLDR